MSQPTTEPLSILLVDDSEDDRWIMRRALREIRGMEVVGEAHDGEEAIAYLNGLGGYGDRTKHPFPDLLLLDLKMPKMTGYDVLRWLRNRCFDRLKVVVVSGSLLPQDKDESLALGAVCYLHKASLKQELTILTQRLTRAFEGV